MDNKPNICHLLRIFDRWWEALHGRVFWRVRVKEITYIQTYIIYLFTQVEIRQHKADVDLRLIKFTNLTPNKPTKIWLRIQFKIPKNLDNLLNPYCKLFARVTAAHVDFESKVASRLREGRDTSTFDHFRLLNISCEKPSDWELNDLKIEKDNPSPQNAKRFVGKQTAWTIDEDLPLSCHLLTSKYRVPRSKCLKWTVSWTAGGDAFVVLKVWAKKWIMCDDRFGLTIIMNNLLHIVRKLMKNI